MITELRYVMIGDSNPILQVRKATPQVDASGTVCGFAIGGWESVPTILFDDSRDYADSLAMDDLVASGGIVGAP